MTDMHMHSKCSDGVLSPKELARLCKQNALANCALTDHDTISGVSEFMKECEILGIKAISGIEFSAEFENELHILGYGFDVQNAGILEQTEKLKTMRRIRAMRYIERLNRQNVDISFDEVMHVAGEAIVGRPHIAEVLCKKGYVSSIKEAFAIYLQEEKQSEKKMRPEEIIELIKSAGGVSVIAHPKLIGMDVEVLLDRLMPIGLGGLEAYYPMHTDSETEYYESLAKRRNLLVTVGGDFHREHHGVQPGGEKRNSKYLDESVRFLFNKY